MTDSQQAFSLLSSGMRKWVSKQGWPGFRDIQAEAIKALLEGESSNVVISAPTSSGKALANYEPVLTDSGWKPIGELTYGDKVYGKDGQLHNILGIYPQGQKEIWKVGLADGREIDCCSEHIWHVINTKTAPTQENGLLRNKTTLELKEKLYSSPSHSWGKRSYRYAIPNCAPITFNADKDAALPLDPYVLGVLLGDGCTCQKGAPVISTSDSFIIEECQKRLPAEYEIRKFKGNKYGYGIHYYKNGVKNPIHHLMEKWGLDVLAKDKFIPEEYFRASVTQRRDLLAGLLDTDGSAVKCSSSFTSTSIKLIEDITRLARGLGYTVHKISVSDRTNTEITGYEEYQHKSISYSVSISSNDILFKLPRKVKKIKEYRKMKRRTLDKSYVKIISIEPTGKFTEMTCITVDSPDSTYITKDYTVTHNTEAAFMPALSILQNYYEEHKTDKFCSMLYIAPLKALINDQHRRLSSMASDLNIPVYLWHGDAPQGQKNRMLREHDGIIMITPESLESFLMNRGAWCAEYMTPLVVVVDEFHAFLGEGRGKQMLSLLDRIDVINAIAGRKPAIRIGLSATLSKLDVVGSILSPRAPFAVIDGTGTGSDEMDIEVKMFEPPLKREGQKDVAKEDLYSIGSEIINGSIGEKTLTFAGSRMQVETISATINDICQENNIKSEAFPHHGSLAKDVREELEHRLVSTDKPTMAVATVTLELGIDIGDIYKVFQVGTTNSVASLRQRVGRSGRRDGHKRVECLVTAAREPLDMEQSLMTTISEIELMQAGWFEPPNNKRRDLSVMVGEILSILKQYGTAYEEELYTILVERGAFSNVPRDMFSMLMEDLRAADFVAVLGGDQLAIGQAGEDEINDWHFYATFQGDEAFTVKSGGKTIGEITPPDTALLQLAQGGQFMLGGKYWKVVPPIDMHNKVIQVQQVAQKSKFLIPTSKGVGGICGLIRRTNIKLLVGDKSDYVPEYLDDFAKEKLEQAREFAEIHKLNPLGLSIYDAGEKGSETDSEVRARASQGYTEYALVKVDPPVNQSALDAIIKVLEGAGMEPGGLSNIPVWRLTELIEAALDNWEDVMDGYENLIDNAMLSDIKGSEKYNHIMSDETLRYAYAEEKLDMAGAKRWMESYMKFYNKVVAKK